MTLPGFTAEVSLESIGRTYRAALGRSGNSDAQTVVAQQWEWWDSHGCGHGCLVEDRNCLATGRGESECSRRFSRCLQNRCEQPRRI
jgi:hypothetical protein